MTPTRLRADIEQQAADLARAHGVVSPNGFTDVETLVHKLGGEVSVIFDTPDRPESLQVRSRNDFTVIVPWNTSIVRDRFTIAHELGHLCLHYQDDGLRSFYRYGRDRQETEANAFASALLMPAAEFEAAYAQLSGDLMAIRERFVVSRAAAGVRAQVLGLS